MLCCSYLSIGSLHVAVFEIFYLEISQKNGIIIIVKGVQNEQIREKELRGKGRQDGRKLNIVVANKREGGEKGELYLRVNIFSTKALIGGTIFTSPTGDGTAILRGHPSHPKV